MPPKVCIGEVGDTAEASVMQVDNDIIDIGVDIVLAGGSPTVDDAFYCPLLSGIEIVVVSLEDELEGGTETVLWFCKDAEAAIVLLDGETFPLIAGIVHDVEPVVVADGSRSLLHK